MNLRFLARVSRLARLAFVIATVARASVAPMAAEVVAGPALKAAFLYNFAKFSEWPADALAPRQRLSLCVMGDNFVVFALADLIRGHVVDGHELTVEAVKPDGALRSCHLLYVSRLDEKRSVQLLDSLRSTSVFTVGDGDGFAQRGGIAQLLLDGERMRFAINVTSAERARLRLSSKLLSLAKMIIVKDEDDVQR